MEARQLLLFLLTICPSLGHQYHIGSTCEPWAGAKGSCAHIKNCPLAQQMMRRGRRSKVCYYVGTRPVVCCPWGDEDPPPLSPTTPTPTPTPAESATPREASTSAFLRTTTSEDDHSWNTQCGDSCALADGAAGWCTAIENCPLAARTGMDGVEPTVCFYDRRRPVVCCPRGDATPLTTSTTPTSTSRATAVTDGISWQKCQEYAEEVDQTHGVEMPVLLFDMDDDDEPKCAQLEDPMPVWDLRCRPKEYPHMAALGYGVRPDIAWRCGGSLISSRYVLTAASCLHAEGSGQVRWVRLGDLNMASTRDASRPQTVEVTHSVAHPAFAPPSLYHDIALLRLGARVRFDAFVRPACLHGLHAERATPLGDAVVAIGWGLVDNADAGMSETLMKSHLRVASAAQCNASYKAVIDASDWLLDGVLDETMLCAGDPDNEQSVCMKDSGSPLQVSLTTPFCMTSVVGVASFSSRACGASNVPAVFTRVSHYVQWIEGVVWPSLV